MVVVFDSSAWIFLSKLGIIEHGISLFSQAVVPRFVEEEIAGRNDEASFALKKQLKSGTIKIVVAKSFRFVNALRKRLGKGEAEAIVVALDIDADFVILDDHAARSIAMQLGLSVKGTLGIIRKLMEAGKYSSDLPVLYENLRNMGFWVKENLFWEIFSQL